MATESAEFIANNVLIGFTTRTGTEHAEVFAPSTERSGSYRWNGFDIYRAPECVCDFEQTSPCPACW